ncbi:hypothetical protein [Aquicella lusitana]|uniref:Uncharacterized protein n=1 Tax=Aquicella lusitana TaxID=254246 RepID=A0A370GYL3_9COXI|nr:hypothetical protein [Aquicella lusitana]RDI48756.1 hypothetical protein C8D86_10135 [Aquicella lusitana]VVC73184.1 Phosphocholine transferase AnkX [Aquicella lusitana]
MATLAKELMIHIEGTDQEFLIQFPDVAEMNDLLTETIRQFHLGAKGILNKSLDERYTFLYEHLQLFLLIHPFIDANNRVFLNTLTPLWHIMLKLPDMPLFYNPFVFYGHTIPEIVATAKLSTANMMAIKEYSNMRKSSYFNFLDQTLTEDQLTLLAQWVMPFRKLMNKVLLQEWIDVIEKNITSKLSAPASVSPTVLFGPISPEQIALGNDLAQMKQCQGVPELSQFLETKAQEYQSIHSRIANLYNGILAEMKMKNQKNVKPF